MTSALQMATAVKSVAMLKKSEWLGETICYSIGPSTTFGWLAGRHAKIAADRRRR
jgi:hypothetical protein